MIWNEVFPRLLLQKVILLMKVQWAKAAAAPKAISLSIPTIQRYVLFKCMDVSSLLQCHVHHHVFQKKKKNWPNSKRWINFTIVFFNAFIGYFSSAVYVGAPLPLLPYHNTLLSICSFTPLDASNRWSRQLFPNWSDGKCCPRKR